MIDFLVNLVNTLPVLGALLLVASANVTRRDRVRQAILPGVAVVFGLVALFVLYRFNQAIDSAVTSVSDALPVVPVVRGQTWLYVLENVFVILAWLLVKFLIRPLFAQFFGRGRRLAEVLVAGVYEFNSDYDMWFIGRRFGNLRLYWRALYWASIALTLVFIALAVTFAEWPVFASVAYPALAAMIVGEFFFAVNGLTRQEFDRDILGEADSARRVANYGPLRKVLVELFPGRVLSDGVHLSSSASVESGHRLSQMVHSDDELEQLAGSYFSRLADNKGDVDINLAEASVQLLRRQSVLVNNPFYTDLTPYLSLPAYYYLLQYRKVLIIAGRDTLGDDLVQWITSGLESITGIPDLWDVEVLTAYGRDRLDVGVLRFADVHNLDVLKNNDEFLRDVEYVILAEPSRMIATGQLGLGLVISRVSRGRVPAFAAFDANNDGLVDALSHLLKLSLTEVVASALPRGSSSEIVWRAEGPHMQAAIVPSVSRYLGVGTEIGAVGLKYQVRQIHWVGSDAFPVTDMMWIAGQYFAQINAFADLDLSQDVFRESFAPMANPWQLPQRANYFLIVEDEGANAYETVRQYATRATSTGFVNVVSENYLLRDYMVDNRELFSADAKAVPAVVPDFARTERNAVLRMILTMVTFEVTEEDLAREFELVGWTVPRLDVELVSEWADSESPLITEFRRAIAEHTGVRDVPIRRSVRHEGDIVNGELQPVITYSIDAGSQLESTVDSLRAAYFVVEDEREDLNRIGSVLYGHVFQTLLPGQFLTHGGKYYEVQSISDARNRNGVVLRRAAEHIRDRRTYWQLRDFEISELQPADVIGARVVVGSIELIRAVARVRATSNGYLEMSDRSSLESSRRVLVSGLPSREYANKSLLELRLPEVPAQVRKTITLLLNELFVTVFPHSHRYLVALTPDDERDLGDLLCGLSVEDAADSIFIVEDSMVDMGLIIAFERNWERFLEIIVDYLAWNGTERPVVEKAPPTDFTPVFPDLPAPSSARRSSWWRRLIAGLRRSSPPPVAQPQPENVERKAGPVPTDSETATESPVDDLPVVASTDTSESEATQHAQ